MAFQSSKTQAPSYLEDPSSGEILVVDDSPQNLLAIEAAFGDLADRLVKAHSGRDALRRLLREDFALVLLDVQMPGMDGLETARLIRARERTRNLPIIFITAFDTDDREVLNAYELGAVDFLFKPIVPEILYAKASVFVALKQHTDQIARQAELLRQHEAREHERELAEQRRCWEAEALRRQIAVERKSSEELARHAEELARSIAERERAERELTRSNQRLAEADRNKDEFLAMLAHELRNPLMPLVTGLELLQSCPQGDPRHDRARQAMARQLAQLCRLVDDLLDVSRINAGKIELRPTRIDLAEVVRHAVSSCEALIDRHGQSIDLRLPDGPVEILGDSARLTQIVCNLVNNASRYTGEGGHLCVSLEAEEEGVLLRVADDGPGIPPEAVDRVFDLFAQETPGEGLGIGLTLVRRLVELHDGSVSVDSGGDRRGSVFTVELPRTGGRCAEIAAPKGAADSLDLDGPAPLKIVLIEDNDDVRETLADLLEMLGHEVCVAGDGHRGVELCLAEKPDVALIDIGLPRLDGYGVAERIRESLPDPPRLVAMTGYGREQDRRRAEEAGFHTYLVKPATFRSLGRVLDEL